MRIAHVTDFYLPRLGGIEMHVSDLAARQVALGHEVTVVTSSPSEGTSAAEGGPDVVRLRRVRSSYAGALKGLYEPTGEYLEGERSGWDPR